MDEGSACRILALQSDRIFGHQSESEEYVPFRILASSFLGLICLPAFGGVIAPNLGSGSSFGLIGGTISNTGTSVVVGNVGATTTITGFPPGTATGTVYPAPSDPTVTAAYNAFMSAFNNAFSDATTPPTLTAPGLSANFVFLGNNVYNFLSTDVTSTANVNLTFDAQGSSSEIFIIKVGRDLTINGPLTFSLVNGALASNIYWIVGRTETISSGGGPVTFDGNILAGSTFTESANPGGSGVLAGTINGCVFAENAATLAGKTQINGCQASGTGPNSGTGPDSTVPEPASFALMGLGLALTLAASTRRLQRS
jgi:Ice-binding-like/PEP-CTERM motif